MQEQTPLSSPVAGLSDDEVSARLDKLLGTNVWSSPPAAAPSITISAIDEKREEVKALLSLRLKL